MNTITYIECNTKGEPYALVTHNNTKNKVMPKGKFFMNRQYWMSMDKESQEILLKNVDKVIPND